MTRTSMKPLAASLAFATTLAATNAFAHISLEQGGGPYLSRNGDTQGDLKEPPCGHANDHRGTNVYTFPPGATVDFTIFEYIPHPSYFRVAFDQDGDDGFIDPASIKPIDPNRACPDGPGDHCGESDFYNSPEVLPNMDNLFPHLPDYVHPPKWTFHVTFPNVECDNCTLQIIQVMEDDNFHGPYDPTPGVGVADIYHQCVDVVLKKGAPLPLPDGGVGGSGAGGSGGDPGSGGSSNGASSSGDSGGCAVAPGEGRRGGAVPVTLGLILGLALRRRRR